MLSGKNHLSESGLIRWQFHRERESLDWLNLSSSNRIAAIWRIWERLRSLTLRFRMPLTTARQFGFGPNPEPFTRCPVLALSRKKIRFPRWRQGPGQDNHGGTAMCVLDQSRSVRLHAGIVFPTPMILPICPAADRSRDRLLIQKIRSPVACSLFSPSSSNSIASSSRASAVASAGRSGSDTTSMVCRNSALSTRSVNR